MVRKIFVFLLLFLSFIFINNKACFCADNFPTLDIDETQAIFDFAINISKISNKTNFNSSTPTGFMNYFNNNVAPAIFDLTNGECDNSQHFIVMCKSNNIYFFTTNATLSNTLDFLKIEQSSGTNVEFYLRYQYCAKIQINGNNSFSYSTISSSGTYATLFYNSSGSATPTPQYDDEKTTLLTPNLFYLGPKPFSEVSFKALGLSTYTWYFLEHYYNFPSGDTPSGDTPSGDAPSGDTPSGDFPNYNDKLDNISGLVSDTNNKLDGISGEIGQTNNKLDGISGELGEINDNLTTVPDLSGTTINSGDIESALNFDFVEDPYSNFWLELTTGLSSALTGTNRTINISFRDKNYIINLDDFSIQVPNILKPFLTIISTVFIVWKLIKYIKITVDKISSGNIDNVLAMNEEERNS